MRCLWSLLLESPYFVCNRTLKVYKVRTLEWLNMYYAYDRGEGVHQHLPTWAIYLMTMMFTSTVAGYSTQDGSVIRAYIEVLFNFDMQMLKHCIITYGEIWAKNNTVCEFTVQQFQPFSPGTIFKSSVRIFPVVLWAVIVNLVLIPEKSTFVWC